MQLLYRRRLGCSWAVSWRHLRLTAGWPFTSLESKSLAKLSTAAARDKFAYLIKRAVYGKERILLTRRGKPPVAVVPIEDLQR